MQHLPIPVEEYLITRLGNPRINGQQCSAKVFVSLLWRAQNYAHNQVSCVNVHGLLLLGECLKSPAYTITSATTPQG